MQPWAISAAALLWAVVSTIVAWAFATGKFAGSSPTKADLEALRSSVAADLAQRRRWIDEELRHLSSRIQGEHDERKRLVEDINVKLGNVQVEQRGQSVQLETVTEDVKELRRRVFNGGIAGV